MPLYLVGMVSLVRLLACREGILNLQALYTVATAPRFSRIVHLVVSSLGLAASSIGTVACLQLWAFVVEAMLMPCLFIAVAYSAPVVAVSHAGCSSWKAIVMNRLDCILQLSVT